MGLSRREFIAASAILAAAGPRGIAQRPDEDLFGGWVQEKVPKVVNVVRASALHIRGRGKNKVVRHWKYLERAEKKDFDPNAQLIGDCTAQAATAAVRTISSIEAAKGIQEYCGDLSTEVPYAGSRVEIGRGAIGLHDGSTGSFMASFHELYGALKRDVYGQYDLTAYSPALARTWGAPNVGVPDFLEPITQEQPIRKTVLVDGGWNQCCDLIASGLPIVVCSGVGFYKTFDSEGFLTPGPRWGHAMLIWGIDTHSRREGACILNSWGFPWTNNQIQHKYGTPRGCFWAEARVIEDMLAFNDSYAYGEFYGPQVENLDYVLL